MEIWESTSLVVQLPAGSGQLRLLSAAKNGLHYAERDAVRRVCSRTGASAPGGASLTGKRDAGGGLAR